MTEVQIIESERGWGQRVDETVTFPSIREAKDFVREFNSQNTADSVPDWYMYAEIV